MALPELDRAVEKQPNDPYWRLFRLTAKVRLGQDADGDDVAGSREWPAPLIDFYASRISADALLQQAARCEHRSEALFHLAVVASYRRPNEALPLWQKIVDGAPPISIEYCAARHELARLATRV